MSLPAVVISEIGPALDIFLPVVEPLLLLTFCPSRIMGLYVSVVLVIGKFVRGFFSEISHSIMFEELPCVDRILKLCTDIFLVSGQRGLTTPATQTKQTKVAQ